MYPSSSFNSYQQLSGFICALSLVFAYKYFKANLSHHVISTINIFPSDEDIISYKIMHVTSSHLTKLRLILAGLLGRRPQDGIREARLAVRCSPLSWFSVAVAKP